MTKTELKEEESKELDWDRLISPKRYQGRDELRLDDDKSEVRSPFVKDADKIIYCSAFRRLQNKTQVHTFPGSDYVRTRLTHSLEVASVGRTLGMAIGRHLVENGVEIKPERSPEGQPRDSREALERADLGNVVAAACLAHDIGNPPFGHAGEHAIRDWFDTEAHELLKGSSSGREKLTHREQADLERFDGNAQGFRILTRLQAWQDDEGGLRLTCATLGAFQKYPRPALVIKKGTDQEVPNLAKKFGYFQEDREAWEKVAKELGLLPSEQHDGTWCRHPLAFLVEAADDICNRVADIEDGYKYKKLDFKTVEEVLRNIAKTGWKKKLNPAMDKDVSKYTNDEKIAYLRAQAVGALIRQALRAYQQYEQQIMRGIFSGDLMSEAASRKELKEIEEMCEKDLFLDESTLRAELAGYEVIRGLLEIYTEALVKWEENNWETTGLPSRYYKAKALLDKSMRVPKSRYGWLLAVTDYVSGMTDGFAVDLYRRLKGISVPGALR